MKIKGLTLEEAKKICDKYIIDDKKCPCKECPYADHKYRYCKLNFEHLDDYGNEEVF